MAGIGSAATRKTIDRLGGAMPAGAAPGALTFYGETGLKVTAQNAPVELAERAGIGVYPNVTVYCEKVVNDLREKFRRFSGVARMAIEVRHSQDRLDGIEEAIEQQADAMTESLSASRGDWGDGMFYAGGYEVSFGRVSRGGKNFNQAAKITFELEIGKN